MITSFVVPIIAVMALAVVHGVLKPKAGCGAQCDTCEHACNSEKAENSHV